MAILDKITETQLWKSIFRHPMPTDRRNRVVVMLTNFFLHLHPVSVRKQGIALSYTWCMGGTTFFLFIVETVTGVLLMFYYRPTLEHAYNDILALRDVTTLVFTLLLSFTGYLLPWDQLAIWAITVGSNMARATPGVGVEGPGASMLKLNGVSLITSGSDAKFALLGGRSVGEMTLNRFYVLHCVAIPLAVSLLIMIHFWRVRKDGGISGPM
jgi:cytochrome b6